jgi:Protein of unknown function (DUF2804)
MPSRHALRPLKAWRYVAVFSPELMACLATVRIGPVRQAFWAVWDREQRRLHERTVRGRGRVLLATGQVQVREPDLALELELEEGPGVECVCPGGRAYAWTRKQAPVAARGTITLDGRRRAVDALAVIDDTAGYYPRHTRWQWSAGVGRADDGRQLAWNLVSGVNDPPQQSERTVWVDGQPQEPPPSTFARDLSAVDGLRFAAEAVRERRENRLLVRSYYRQPFGSFSGELAAGVTLASGLGVMEEHDVWW